jgi:hypothetical protein
MLHNKNSFKLLICFVNFALQSEPYRSNLPPGSMRAGPHVRTDTKPYNLLAWKDVSLYAGVCIVTARAVGNQMEKFCILFFLDFHFGAKKDHTGILMPMRPSFLASILSLAP